VQFDPSRDLEFVPLFEYEQGGDEFDCGNQDLNNFILEPDEAGFFEKENLGRTTLVFLRSRDSGRKLVAYYTISCSQIRFEEMHFLRQRTKISNFPAIKIGRLAVIKEFGRFGIGTYCIDNVLLIVNQISKRVGVRYLIVDAYLDLGVTDFYEHYGFKPAPFTRKGDMTALLYFDILSV